MKLGVRLESLGLPFRSALAAAAKLGARGVQFDAVGDFHPDRLSATGRREVGFLLRSHGLETTALRCDVRRPLSDETQLEARLDDIRKVMTLSFELGARMILVEAGAIPEADDDPPLSVLRESLHALITHGDRCGSAIALEVGNESPERMSTLLGSLPVGMIGVNFNPANLLMHGFDPVPAVTTLKSWLLHAQAQDGRRGGASRLAQPVALGGGDIDWMTLLGTLSANDYHGWLVVHTNDRNAAGIENGVKFLRRLI
jgi:sugar phosphate isomerase/epimerase